MEGCDRTASPLETVVGEAGPRVTEAFKRLGNETRLAILLALWEAYEPFGDDAPVPFSDLRERVGMRDKGQFYYHLNRLVPHFVRQSEDGYELRNAGRNVVRTVIAGTGLQERTLDHTALDTPCPYCGAGTAITYERERLYQVCTECQGTFAGDDALREGTLTVWPFDQAGLADRTPEELFMAGAVATIQQYAAMNSGVCPECSGPVEASLDRCDGHERSPEGVCPACDRRYPIQARFVCTVCKNKMWGPPSVLSAILPRAIAFYASRGVDLGYGSATMETVETFVEIVREHDRARLVSTDPMRVSVAFRCKSESLELTLDDSLDVVESTVVTSTEVEDSPANSSGG